MVETRSTSKSGRAAQADKQRHRTQQAQLQLVCLLHARQCIGDVRLDAHLLTAVRSDVAAGCDMLFCGKTKAVLNHIIACTLDSHICTYPHCGSSRRILAHWETCKHYSCVVCRRFVVRMWPNMVPKPTLRRSLRKRKTNNVNAEDNNQQTKGNPESKAVSTDKSNAGVCSICQDRMRNRFFINCGHTACEVCADLIREEPLTTACKFCGVRPGQREKEKICPWCRVHLCDNTVQPMHMT